MIPDESEPPPDPEPSPRGDPRPRWAPAGRPERFLREIVDSVRRGGKLDNDSILTARLQHAGLYAMVAARLDERALPYSEHLVLALAFQKTVLTGATRRNPGALVEVFQHEIDEAIAFSAERALFVEFDEVHPRTRSTDRQRRRLTVFADYAAALPLDERRIVIPYLRRRKTAGELAAEFDLGEGAVRALLARHFKEGHARALQVEQAIAAHENESRQRRPRRKR